MFLEGHEALPCTDTSRHRHFYIETNAALDYQTFHAEPQSLLSRRDDTCERLRSLSGLRPYEDERLRSLSGLRPYEESAERPSVYVERMRRERMMIYCENSVGSSL